MLQLGVEATQPEPAVNRSTHAVEVQAATRCQYKQKSSISCIPDGGVNEALYFLVVVVVLAASEEVHVLRV